MSVSARGLEVLRELADPSVADTSGEIDPRIRGELCGLLNHYLTNLLGHPPRMLPFLGFLVNP